MITIIPTITTFSSYCHIFFLWPCNLWSSCGHLLPLSPHSLILDPLQYAMCLTLHPHPHAGAGLSSPLPHAMVILSKATVSPASLSFECAWSRRFPETPGWAPLVAPHMCLEHLWATQLTLTSFSRNCLYNCPLLLKGQDHLHWEQAILWAAHCGGHEPHVPAERLTCGLFELRSTGSIKYAWGSKI